MRCNMYSSLQPQQWIFTPHVGHTMEPPVWLAGPMLRWIREPS